MGSPIIDDIYVFEGRVRTPGSIPANSAKPTQNAFILNTIGRPTPGGTGLTTNYRNLDLLGSATYEQLSLDMLCLDNGNGTLYIGPGATFIGNGVVKGNIANSGLVIIPITKIAGSLGLVVAPPSGPGGTVIVPRPEIPLPEPVVITPPIEQTEVPASGALFIGGSGGGFVGGSGGGGGGSPAAPITIWQGDLPTVKGTIGWDGKLEVTGSYTQTATGIARFYIAGEAQGISYSQLAVGKQVTLDGTLQVVLRPELFGYLPEVGDYFDIITSDIGIALADADLRIDTLVMAAGASALGGVFDPLLAYNSGFAGDPDTLLDITPDIFAYSIVNGGKTLRVTLVDPIRVPEPATACLALLACAGAFVAWVLRPERT